MGSQLDFLSSPLGFWIRRLPSFVAFVCRSAGPVGFGAMWQRRRLGKRAPVTWTDYDNSSVSWARVNLCCVVYSGCRGGRVFTCARCSIRSRLFARKGRPVSFQKPSCVYTHGGALSAGASVSSSQRFASYPVRGQQLVPCAVC